MTLSIARPGLSGLPAAGDRISGSVRRTPLLAVDSLPGILIKAEHSQRGGSFKVRGAANAMIGLGARTAGAVVTGSSGNHGLAVAVLGRALGVGVTVVMAEGASEAKAAAIRRLGGRVVRIAGDVVERDRYAREHGALLVPSSDHELVVGGAATVGLEVLEDAPDVDAIFVPTGGGGLLAGVCLAAEWLRRSVRIVGVEPASGRRYARSLAEGRLVEIPPPDTIADGLRGQRAGEVPFPIIQRRVDAMIGVTDEAIVHSMDRLRRAGVEAEPSGAVALAGVLRSGFTGRAVAIVSGGNTAASLDRITATRKGSP